MAQKIYELDRNFEINQFAVINGIKLKKLGNLFQMTLPPTYIGTDWIDCEGFKYSTINQNVVIATIQSFESEIISDLCEDKTDLIKHNLCYSKLNN